MVSFSDDVTPYIFGYGCERSVLAALSDACASADTLLFVVDSSLTAIAGRVQSQLATLGRTIHVLSLTTNVEMKSLATVQQLLQRAVALGATKRTSVVAIGGGILGNIAEMLAGLLYRGVPLLHLPATPVAAFDSVLSRKQAVNVDDAKNALGLHKTPTFIGLDLSWLETIPDAALRTGLIEMSKNVLAVRPDHHSSLLKALRQLRSEPEEALSRLLEIGTSTKLPYLEIDADERREALVFEYGHKVGHAIEGASRGRMSHGEAVGWGMIAEAGISRTHAGFSDSDYDSHIQLLEVLGICREASPGLPGETVRQFIRVDNKRGPAGVGEGEIPMVPLPALGRPLTTQRTPLCGVGLPVIDEAVSALLGAS